MAKNKELSSAFVVSLVGAGICVQIPALAWASVVRRSCGQCWMGISGADLGEVVL